MQRALIIIFVLLLFVAVAETGFYVGRSSNVPNPTPKTAVLNSTGDASTKSVTDDLQVSLLESLEKTPKDILVDSIITNELKGVVSDLTVLSNGDLRMRLEGKRNEVKGFIFNKNDLSKLLFFKIEDKKENLISYKEIHTGDEVSIALIIDLLKNYQHNLVSGKIVVSE